MPLHNRLLRVMDRPAAVEPLAPSDGSSSCCRKCLGRYVRDSIEGDGEWRNRASKTRVWRKMIIEQCDKGARVVELKVRRTRGH